jgi:ribonuclease P protein subunit RPR2
VKSRKQAKEEATGAAESLIHAAVKTSHTDIDLADAQAESARRLMLKYNVRLDYSSRRFFCHGCKKLIVPGVNATVRLSKSSPSRISLTCHRCGFVNRKIIRRP